MSLHDGFFLLFSSITYFLSLSGPLKAYCGLAFTSRPCNYVVCGKQDGKDGICRHVCEQMSENVPSHASCSGNISPGKESIYKGASTCSCTYIWPLLCCQGSQTQCDLLCKCQLPYFLAPRGRFKFSTHTDLEVISLKNKRNVPTFLLSPFIKIIWKVSSVSIYRSLFCILSF